MLKNRQSDDDDEKLYEKQALKNKQKHKNAKNIIYRNEKRYIIILCENLLGKVHDENEFLFAVDS